MARRSRKNMKGGDKIDDIVFRLDSIKEEIRGLKGLGSTARLEESIMGVSPVIPQQVMPEVIPQQVMPQQVMPPVMPQQVMPGATMAKPWMDDKNMKFRDGAGGRVTLGFGRLISLLDNNINRGNVNKDWASIKRDLIAANSVGEVQNIIDRYQISFSSNYVAGTRRNKKGGKRRTRRRH
jgi:hypothetical protein